MPFDVLSRLGRVGRVGGEEGASAIEDLVREEVGVDDQAYSVDRRVASAVEGRFGEGVEPGFDRLDEVVGVAGTRGGHEEDGEEVGLARVELGKGGVEGGGGEGRSDGGEGGEEGEEEEGEERAEVEGGAPADGMRSLAWSRRGRS